MYYFNSKNLLEVRGNDVQCSKFFSGAITENKPNREISQDGRVERP